MRTEPIERTADGVVRILGPLTFDTVEAVRAAVGGEFAPHGGDGPVILDLAAVEPADSAGLALVVEWHRAARRAGRRIHFRSVPGGLRAIAGLCGVDRHLFG